ncbi:nuclease A inhibitor family protein [Gloeobacter violaceus]|uniref:Gll2299 protein n=1 Tax=Gloeobacter violaceus (strain ATCC 29082 / PCC 7421) TaxID=251221 RepID=Q7NI84_GLOVI|nr:nuclease A inhibitor family protein [Gloeobacter violaceus]BAC90240.1 gll2299 [Gloeobacter violaceus PCC 7421]
MEPDFSQPTFPPQGAAAELERAAHGLLFPSETDAPFEAFEWPVFELNPEQLLENTGHPPDMAVSALDLDAFFAPACREADWQEPRQRATAQRFQALLGTLKNALDEIKVYRVGGVEADVYIVGLNQEGTLSGLKTRIVET